MITENLGISLLHTGYKILTTFVLKLLNSYVLVIVGEY